MAFDPVLEPEPAEQVFRDITFYGFWRWPDRLMLTNRAVYWPGFNGITTRRMPLDEIILVSIRDVWHLGKLLVAGIMLISGAIGIYWATNGFVAPRAGDNVALAVILVSAVLCILSLFVAIRGGRRRTLVIASEQTQYTWAEPHVFSGVGPGAAMFEQVCAWAQNNGLRLEVELRE